VGRYALYGQIAAGGMGRIYLGRLLGPSGFARALAIKRLHPPYAKDPEFVSMLLDEARLAARIRHPNVVQTLDVLEQDGELFVMLEYVHGESLSRLERAAESAQEPIPIPVIAAIGAGFLHGLHAAHEATDDRGRPLGLVHRDISPQNVLVGRDGFARVLDFGVAKAAGRMRATREGEIKGKLAYMAPEHLHGTVTRRSDIYAAGVVLWELIASRRLFDDAPDLAELFAGVSPAPERPGLERADVPAELESVVMRALRHDPEERFESAREMALAIERAAEVALPSMVGTWVERMVPDRLREQSDLMAEMEAQSLVTVVPPASPVSTEVSTEGPARAIPDRHRGSRATLARAAPVIAGMLIAAVAFAVAVRALRGEPQPKTPSAAVDVPTLSVAVPALAPAPSATASAIPSPPLTSRHPPASVARPVPPPKARASATVRADCDPPYDLNASGQKEYKLHCL